MVGIPQVDVGENFEGSVGRGRVDPIFGIVGLRLPAAESWGHDCDGMLRLAVGCGLRVSFFEVGGWLGSPQILDRGSTFIYLIPSKESAQTATSFCGWLKVRCCIQLGWTLSPCVFASEMLNGECSHPKRVKSGVPTILYARL